MYATAGITASHVSRTIDGSGFYVGLRQNTYPVSVETDDDLCRQLFVRSLHARIEKPKTVYLHLVSVETGV